MSVLAYIQHETSRAQSILFYVYKKTAQDELGTFIVTEIQIPRVKVK